MEICVVFLAGGRINTENVWIEIMDWRMCVSPTLWGDLNFPRKIQKCWWKHGKFAGKFMEILILKIFRQFNS